MSARTAGTRRPRLLPAALLAAGVVIGTAASVLAATDPPAAVGLPDCADGRDWVTVHPLVVIASDWRPAHRVTQPALTGCLDVSQLPETSRQSDSRG